MSDFEKHLSNIISGTRNIVPSNTKKSMSKEASVSVQKDITVESLRKIATILRNTKAEPSYEDLAKFVDRIV